MSNQIHRIQIGIVLAACLLLPMGSVMAAEDESKLAEQLQSAQTPPGQKDNICQTLRITGTAKSVPALASLLTDESLSHSARLALQPMRYPEAGAALRNALAKTSGRTKAGIIDSLGERRERESVAVLIPLVKDADSTIACAAALALGKIGGPQALESLRSARAGATDRLQNVIVDSLLLCADSMLAGGDAKGASPIYKEIYDLGKPAHLRAAAYRGMVLAAGDGAVDLVVKALAGDDSAILKIAIQFVRELKGESATKAFVAAMGKYTPQVQIALLEALAQRGDKAAAPGVAALVKSQSADVRRAALVAIGPLGDASHAMLLAETAATSSVVEEQDAARRSLALLRDPKVCDVLMAALAQAPAALQGEIVAALGQRQEASAVPALLKMVEGRDEATASFSLRSLAMLATAEHHKELARLLLVVQRDPDREAAEKALLAACLRSDKPQTSVPDLLECMKGARRAGSRGVAARDRPAGRRAGAGRVARACRMRMPRSRMPRCARWPKTPASRRARTCSGSLRMQRAASPSACRRCADIGG